LLPKYDLVFKKTEGEAIAKAELIKQFLASGVTITQVATVIKITSDGVEQLALMDVKVSKQVSRELSMLIC
jgi:hypothetical protein